MEVAQAILERLPATLVLASSGFAAAIAFGALIGFVRARARVPVLRNALALLQLVFRATPVFVLALLLPFTMVTMSLPPQAGAPSAESFDLASRLRYAIAPVLCLALPFGAWASLIFYDFFRASDGAGRAPTLRAVGPIALSAAAIGPALLTATLIVEPMAAWPGMARLFYSGLSQHDRGLIAGCLLAYLIAVVLLKLAARFSHSMPQVSQPPRQGVSPIGIIAFGVLLAAVVGAVAANLIAPVGPNFIDQAHWMGYPLAPGVAGHPLGTDESGRDLLARLLFGLRTSLVIAAVAAVIATAIAALVAKATTARPWFARGTLYGIGIRAFAALPFILAVSVLARKTQPAILSSLGIALIIGVVAWPAIVPALRVRTRGTLGAVVDLAACALLLEVTLSSFGAGVQPPTPSLGNMFANALSDIPLAPWIPIASALVVVGTLFALYALADELREMGSGSLVPSAKRP